MQDDTSEDRQEANDAVYLVMLLSYHFLRHNKMHSNLFEVSEPQQGRFLETQRRRKKHLASV